MWCQNNFMEVVFFNTRVEKFIDSLSPQLESRSKKVLFLLQKFGNNLEMPDSKSLGKGLFELRVTGRVHVRFIYAFHTNKAWILHGFIKKTEQTPKQDLDYAHKQLNVLLQ